MTSGTALGFLFGNPPAFAPFLAAGFATLAIVAGIAFALRKSPALVAIRGVLDGIVGALVSIALLAMVFLSALQILLRNVFHSGLPWIDPLLRELVLILAILGGIVATGRKHHIQINFLERFLRGRALRIVAAIASVIAVWICLAVAHASLLLIRDELETGQHIFFGIPTWAILLVIPFGFLSFALRFAYLVPLELVGEAPLSAELQDAAPAISETPASEPAPSAPRAIS